ncbi:MAG: hypothetical protein E6I65_09545 [Chloroflexi bacterium]|nr:MAG: hypothetical protein E6I65_09545 [Chloroflexota bacterium]
MRTIRRLGLLLAAALVLAGCAGLLESAPTPDPESFPEIAGQLGRFGISVSNWVSGDPGCDDQSLSPTAIRFDAEGLDQATPVVLRIYIFRNREAWDRRLADVDTCAAAWATNPATFEQLQVSPYVVAGQGPWPPAFAAALRTAITAAAGNGG